jgi:hypothetical protein
VTTSRQKAIGSAAERAVAYALDGRRVGMDGGPVDVIVEGYLDVQVKCVKALPSLAAVIGYLEAIPDRDRLRACVVVTRPGQGRKAIRTITFDLDEFASWHGHAGVDAWPNKVEVAPEWDAPEGEPLWGPDGPSIGQTHSIAGIGMRWTGSYWERTS